MRRVYAQDGTQPDHPDADIVWGPEYLLLTQTWPCMAQAGWFARITRWHWTLDGPKRLTATSDRQGFQPDLHGDGHEASAHLMPETKGAYRLTLDATWEGDWGTAIHTQTHGPVDHHIGEIRSHLLPPYDRL